VLLPAPEGPSMAMINLLSSKLTSVVCGLVYGYEILLMYHESYSLIVV